MREILDEEKKLPKNLNEFVDKVNIKMRGFFKELESHLTEKQKGKIRTIKRDCLQKLHDPKCAQALFKAAKEYWGFVKTENAKLQKQVGMLREKMVKFSEGVAFVSEEQKPSKESQPSVLSVPELKR